MVGQNSESIMFGSFLYADSNYVFGFLLLCQEGPKKIHSKFTQIHSLESFFPKTKVNFLKAFPTS